jgi:hypothetical protein
MARIFRVRNLIVQVLPIECADDDDDSGNGGGGGCDDSGCDDSGCDDSGCDDSGCDDSGCNDASCDADSRCDQPSKCDQGSTCDAYTTCDPGKSACDLPTNCTDVLSLCNPESLHCPDPTLNCEIYPSNTNPCLIPVGSNCTGYISNCLPAISIQPCGPIDTVFPPTPQPGCHQIFSDCDITQTRLPFVVCFRSNEARANPNSLADLNVLRRQLALALKLVTRRERKVAAALTPKTKAGVEDAEAHLTRALEDLKKIKQYVQAKAERKKTGEGRAKSAPAKASRQRKGGRRK